jgi:hypothetical protein
VAKVQLGGSPHKNIFSPLSPLANKGKFGKPSSFVHNKIDIETIIMNMFFLLEIIKESKHPTVFMKRSCRKYVNTYFS